MSLNADVYVEAAAELAQDTDYDTWSVNQWVRWLNDGQDAINLIRPDAFSDVQILDCVVGAKQTLPAGAVRLLDLYRNVGSDGNTPGVAIRGPVHRETIDAFEPSWTTASPVTAVRQYLYDISVPEVYWVNPPLTAATKIEGALALEPTWVSDPAGSTAAEQLTALGSVAVALNRRYKPALIEWMLFRAFERDSERSPNWQKAARHAQMFFNLLERKMTVDLAIDPRVVAEMN